MMWCAKKCTRPYITSAHATPNAIDRAGAAEGAPDESGSLTATARTAAAKQPATAASKEGNAWRESGANVCASMDDAHQPRRRSSYASHSHAGGLRSSAIAAAAASLAAAMCASLSPRSASAAVASACAAADRRSLALANVGSRAADAAAPSAAEAARGSDARRRRAPTLGLLGDERRPDESSAEEAAEEAAEEEAEEEAEEAACIRSAGRARAKYPLHLRSGTHGGRSGAPQWNARWPLPFGSVAFEALGASYVQMRRSTCTHPKRYKHAA